MKAQNHKIPRLALSLAALVVSLSVMPAAQAAGWFSTGSLNTARRSHTATLLPNGQVLVAGGFSGWYTVFSYPPTDLASAELYDPATGTWTATGAMTTNRANHTATLLLNGQVLVAGGLSGNYPYTNVASAELYHPAAGTWTATGPMTTPRTNHTATLLLNGKVLVAGGSGATNRAELYDPVSGTWAATGPMTANRANHTATLLPNGQVLVAGGSGAASAEVYDPVNGTWTATGAMTTNRFNHTATLLPNGQVLVAGGGGSAYDPFMGDALPSAELYDPASRTWTATGAMTTSRVGHTATLLPKGSVLVAAGQPTTYLPCLVSAEVYDAASGTWKATNSLATARMRHTATLLPNGRVLVAGGDSFIPSTSVNCLASTELYEPANGAWAVTGSLSTGRSEHTATLLPDGQVLVAGGAGGTGIGFSTTNSAELYNPASRSWTLTGTLNTGRRDHTATLLLNGKVLAAGGYGSAAPTNTAELYDPASGTWTLTGSLNTARQYHTATLLPTGQVLVAGGISSSDLAGRLATAELYDPASGTWTATGSMTTNRMNHTATLLPNGQVLVAGGGLWVEPYLFLASAELYDPASGTWTATGAMNRGRFNHTATLLPSGQVLVAGGFNGTNGYLTVAELYDVARGTWTVTGAMTAGRDSHTATLLLDGQVLVAGGWYGSYTDIAWCELYDPATGLWRETGWLNSARMNHTATLLLNGQVLTAGGRTYWLLAGAELYDVGLGFNTSWQPQIATFTSPLSSGGCLALTGSRFRGVSEGACGNTQNSPADHPVVQLRSVESGQTLFLLCTNWSTNSFLSARVSGLPPGWTLATVFVNGIPSASSLLRFDAVAMPPICLANAARLPGGAFRFGFTNVPGLGFTVLASTNVALPSSSWTVLGNATELSPGQFQFTDPQATSHTPCFYRVRSP